MANRPCLYAFLLLLTLRSTMIKADIFLPPPHCRPVIAPTLDKIEFLLNLLTYKAEFYLRSSTGLGINDISPGLVRGPIPIGATVANLDKDTRNVIEEFGLTGVGHIRAVVETTSLNSPILMPLLDISQEAFAIYFNQILNTSYPPFNIYANANNFLMEAVFTSYLVQQYSGAIIPSIAGKAQQQLVARIALIQAAEYGVIRGKLYDRVDLIVPPYTVTVGDIIRGGAQLEDRLGGCGLKDEGLIVPLQLGAENRTMTNVIAADVNSLAYPRFEREMLRLFFATGNATQPGGIFPLGFKGKLFQLILKLKLS